MRYLRNKIRKSYCRLSDREEIYERQRRKMYDYKNQLSTIQTLIKNGHTNEALSFTQKLTESIAVEMSAINTNHPVVNAVLKSGCCPAHGRFGGRAAPCYQGEPALLDGKAAVELLGYAPAPGLGGALVYLSVENLSAKTLAVGGQLPAQPGGRHHRRALYPGRGPHCPVRWQACPLRQLCSAPLRRECGGRLGVHAEPLRRPRSHAPLLL